MEIGSLDRHAQGVHMPILAVLILMLAANLTPSQVITPQIAAGWGYSAALSSHGRVWTWGDSQYGQLGRGGASPTVPGMVPGLNNITGIACGRWHMLVVTSSGQVWVWGYGIASALGLAQTLLVQVPQLLPGVSGAAQVAAGDMHSLILLGNGTVLAFGHGWTGATGLGVAGTTVAPTLIPGLVNVVAISACGENSAAIMSNGTLRTWGNNNSGQLGFSGGNALSPTQVPGLSAITAVSCGLGVTLCLDSAGVVRQWGSSTTYTGSTPQVVAIPAPAMAIAAAGGLMALTTTGAVHTWGCLCSMLGAGPSACTATQPVFQPVGLGSNMVAIAFGFQHGTALAQSGTISTWGSNGYLELGYSTPGATTYAPAAIPVLDLTEFALYLAPVGGFTELRWFHGTPSSTYANICTAAVQNPSTSGLVNFGGLWITFADLFAWSTLVQAGYPMATGSLDTTGAAVVTLPMPNSALSGVTVNAVSFNLLAGSITNISPVVTHAF